MAVDPPIACALLALVSLVGSSACGGAPATATADDVGSAARAPEIATPTASAEEDPYAGGRAPSSRSGAAPATEAAPARSADELFADAQAKMNARDGRGCLDALDAHDRLETAADTRSTSAAAFHQASTRAQCLMLNGQCDAGKALFRLAYTLQYGTVAPAQVDSITESHAGLFCPAR